MEAEMVEEGRELGREPAEVTGDQERTEGDQHSRGHHLDQREMAPGAAVERRQTVEGEPGHDEGHPEAERVGEEEPSTAASTGPMHGVHAKANAIPMSGAAQAPKASGRTWKRRSPTSHAALPDTLDPSRAQTPAGSELARRIVPSTTITAPATVVSSSLWNLSRCPSPEAAAPNATNTSVNPPTKSNIPRTRGTRLRPGACGAATGPAAVVGELGPGPAPTSTSRRSSAWCAGSAGWRRAVASSVAESPDTIDR